MSSFWNVMTIGPTIPSMYLDKRLDDDKDYGMNIFNPETDACRSWLNGKPNGSVVYVSFGSLASPEANEMQELALALKGSDCNFLWVITNAKLVEDVWGIGITGQRNQNDLATKETIERCLNELVNGEKGKEIKMNTIKWKNLAKKAVEEGGISDKNIDEFI
ncbi:hypothetical protein Gorai_020928, partial [Gossypium raimondii]|nr:hypothetical protein [Gossypium raimondii]